MRTLPAVTPPSKTQKTVAKTNIDWKLNEDGAESEKYGAGPV